jgi:ATP-dependent exoDNAse (exonuclease V) beta subunit
MQVGSVVHRWLQAIAEEGMERYDEARIEQCRPRMRRMLERLGTGPADIERALARVVDALVATLRDERGRWVLSGEHAQAQNELPLTLVDGGQFRQVVIDRTFVTSDGCRWIVDYKTGTRLGGDVESFLRLEAERHRAQLVLYREALGRLAAGEIRTALYYPLLTAFREIRTDAAP